MPLPSPELRLARGLRADPRGLPRHLPGGREGGGRTGHGALGPGGPPAGRARARGHRRRIQAQLPHLAARLVPHHVQVPVRGAERGDAGGGGVRGDPGRCVPGDPSGPEVPGALASQAIPFAGAAARDPGGLLSRGRGPQGEAVRSRSWTTTRSRPAPSTTCTASSSVPTATRRWSATRATSPTKAGRSATATPRSTSSTSGCWSTSSWTASMSCNRWCGRSGTGRSTLVNPFKCKPLHKKAIFAVLTDDDVQALLQRGGTRGDPRARALDAKGGRGHDHARTARRWTCPRSSARNGSDW